MDEPQVYIMWHHSPSYGIEWIKDGAPWSLFILSHSYIDYSQQTSISRAFGGSGGFIKLTWNCRCRHKATLWSFRLSTIHSCLPNQSKHFPPRPSEELSLYTNVVWKTRCLYAGEFVVPIWHWLLRKYTSNNKLIWGHSWQFVFHLLIHWTTSPFQWKLLFWWQQNRDNRNILSLHCCMLRSISNWLPSVYTLYFM